MNRIELLNFLNLLSACLISLLKLHLSLSKDPQHEVTCGTVENPCQKPQSETDCDFWLQVLPISDSAQEQISLRITLIKGLLVLIDSVLPSIVYSC